MTYRILVTGSRDWTDYDAIYEALHRAYLDAVLEGEMQPILISGACPTGADYLAEKVWTMQGLPVERHPADWEKHGKRAGFIRNQEMVDLGARVCLAFIKNESKGASMTARIAEAAAIPVRRRTV